VSRGSIVPHPVIAGLDPAIHPLRKNFLRRMMDPRVKPAGDGSLTCATFGFPNLLIPRKTPYFSLTA